MIQHFQFKNIYENQKLPGWFISFYYKGQKLTATYHKNGTIEWDNPSILDPSEEEIIKKQIHELMLFHVYE